MNERTPEEKADIDTRIAEFLKRHESNTKELEIDFATFPQFVQTAGGAYATSVSIIPMDLKYRSKPSPFSTDKVIK